MSIAGLFPGQGSQSQGMLSALAATFPIVEQSFEQASEVLRQDLWQIVQQGPDSALNSTENTQPLMLTAGVAAWRVWQQQGGCMPVAVAGHSLGEYSALVAAGVLDFTDAVQVVRLRAQLMQQAVPEGQGAMAAILGLADDEIIAACAQAEQASAPDSVVEAVNFNAPGQVVIAGSAAAVDTAITLAKEKGAKKAIALPVSVPSHCRLMQAAAAPLLERLNALSLQSAAIPVLHNVDAQARTDAVAIRQALAEQLYRPVRWTDTIQQLQHAYSVTSVIEFGPGKVLAGLNRRIERSMAVAFVYDPESLDAALKLCEA